MLTLKDYDRFALADPVFYDVPERYPDDHDRIPAARRQPPEGWERDESDWWVSLRPRGAPPPAPGWRIHVSVTPDRLARAAGIVWGHCMEHGLAFGFLRSAATARELNGHRADRFRGGRTITVHAGDEAALTRTLGELAVLLDGLAGVYVLGALRHGNGPLYVRYATGPGAPRRRPDGTPVAAPRRAAFTVPDGVRLPEVLRSDLAALHAPPAGGFPYRAERALRLRHGGGTYLATDTRTGERVVLHEARPHAGLDRHGDDAVARLGRRRAALERLAGLACVPRLAGHLTHLEHHFLAEEHIEGDPLQRAAAAAFPLTSAARAAREAGPYTRWALEVLGRIEEAVGAVRSRGLRLAALDPATVLLRPDGSVVLTGLASAVPGDDDRPAPAGDPSFSVPAGLGAAAAARYLLDRLRLWLFLPVPYTGTGPLRALAAAVEEHYPVPRGFGTALLSGLRPPGRCERGNGKDDGDDDAVSALLTAQRPDWPAIRDALVRGIHAGATPDRPDRLFPGSPSGPREIGGTAFAHGAAGVLYALHGAGADVPDAYTAWLTAAVRRESAPRAGLYEGLHGVALTLDVLGRREAALEVLERCPPANDPAAPADLAGGRAGIALTLLHFASVTGDTALHDRALRLAGELARTTGDGPLPAVPGRPPPHGLLHGPAGVALLFLRLYEQSGDGSWTGHARRALRHDLAGLRTLADGTVALAAGTGPALPYLQGGSAGLAFVLPELHRHRPDRATAALPAAIRRTCDAVYVHTAGLLRGRAGTVAALVALGEPAGGPVLLRQVRRLAWHARSYRGHLAFPGFRPDRLSSDLATGAAGVLLALRSAFEGTGVLPFLGARSMSVPSAPSAAEGR
ncbi:class III lanthionine synthetase LanKC [Streptomyces cinnamoneus]|uniref:Serine/threonine protein kinase n=1 Tax=Streptomyces cinnamoneus TaxID=53446 RepID=A0A918TFV9_STRCJ|nr:class III lanthionine synthetase LanKC [Streptomyces cinnamoneus]GHC46211.1 serine/threonine protein kinase [Streptomyces cinnamoneus]